MICLIKLGFVLYLVDYLFFLYSAPVEDISFLWINIALPV